MTQETPTTPKRLDSQTLAVLDELVTKAGGDLESLDGKLVRELLHTSLKLLGDGTDTGELKLLNRSVKELRYALGVFRPFRGRRKISVFGSARTPEDHPDYRAAEAFSAIMARKEWMVITGAGDGIMRAGHDGAGREASFGVAIRLPFETTANEFIADDDKLITFRYFFTRKLMFVSQSDAVALFPGGFGTHDEGFEVLTLVQTGKALLVPIVMVATPGDDYWTRWDAYVRDQLLAKGMISKEDLNLYHITDDVEDAAEHVANFYRNYHSQRFVRDDLVLRVQRELTDAQMDALNDEFAVLVESGRIQQGAALAGEGTFLDLPRIYFHSTRRNYGKLRAMIDRINEFDAANGP